MHLNFKKPHFYKCPQNSSHQKIFHFHFLLPTNAEVFEKTFKLKGREREKKIRENIRKKLFLNFASKLFSYVKLIHDFLLSYRLTIR